MKRQGIQEKIVIDLDQNIIEIDRSDSIKLNDLKRDKVHVDPK